MRAGGIGAVQVEPIARALGATKGSFYWHFADRAALLAAVLEWWKDETRWLVEAAREAETPRGRLHRYFELVAAHREYPPDAEILSWARRDADVARQVHDVERARLAFIEGELEGAGRAPEEARRLARIAYFATQGWVERASRGEESYPRLPEFTAHLFGLMLGPEPTDRS
jgi:AcrR family transcriptional regulator